MEAGSDLGASTSCSNKPRMWHHLMPRGGSVFFSIIRHSEHSGRAPTGALCTLSGRFPHLYLCCLVIDTWHWRGPIQDWGYISWDQLAVHISKISSIGRDHFEPHSYNIGNGRYIHVLTHTYSGIHLLYIHVPTHTYSAIHLLFTHTHLWVCWYHLSTLYIYIICYHIYTLVLSMGSPLHTHIHFLHGLTHKYDL